MKAKSSTFYAASLLGNVLEWYDFALYGLLSTVFAQLFFSSSDPGSAILATLAIFAVGYIIRPIGGLFIGHFGDTHSRKRALIFSLSLMGVATGLIGLLPTYDHVGIWASLLLVLLRLIQGFAVGGEFPGSMVVLREIAARSPAFATALSVSGAMGGFLLGSGLIALLLHHMSHAAFISWGWRFAFILGFFLAILGIVIRVKVMRHEKLIKQKHVPVIQLWRHYKTQTLVAMGQLLLAAVFTAMASIFLVTYLNHYLKVSLHHTMLLLFVGTIIQIMIIPGSAWLADRLNNHRAWAMFGTVILILLSAPCFWLIQRGGMAIDAGVLMFITICSIAVAQTTYIVVESFPQQVRYSGAAFSHGLVMASVGFTPLLMNALLLQFGMVAPAYLLIGAAVLALLGVFKFKPQ